jgi:hypothetical protein
MMFFIVTNILLILLAAYASGLVGALGAVIGSAIFYLIWFR